MLKAQTRQDQKTNQVAIQQRIDHLEHDVFAHGFLGPQPQLFRSRPHGYLPNIMVAEDRIMRQAQIISDPVKELYHLVSEIVAKRNVNSLLPYLLLELS